MLSSRNNLAILSEAPQSRYVDSIPANLPPVPLASRRLPFSFPFRRKFRRKSRRVSRRLRASRVVALVIQTGGEKGEQGERERGDIEARRVVLAALQPLAEIASAKQVRVEVCVCWAADVPQGLLQGALTLRAGIVVLGAAKKSSMGFKSSSISSATQETVTLLARHLPTTTKVMLVSHGACSLSKSGELSTAPNPSPSPLHPSASPVSPLSALNTPLASSAAAPTASYTPSPGSASPLRADPRECQPVGSGSDSQRGSGERGEGGEGEGRGGGEMMEVDGEGMGGVVGRGGGEACAVNTKQFLTELRVVRKVRHPNLLRMLGACVTAGELLMVFDYLPNGALDMRLRDNRKPPLTWQQRLEIASGAARGLAFLHSGCRPPIIHRDVKSGNILLDEDLEPVVSDFGLAKVAPEHFTQPMTVTAIMGTQGYVAPEYVRTGKITEAVDVFAFGVVLLELITGHIPFHPSRTPAYLFAWAIPVAKSGEFHRLVDYRLEGRYDPSQLQAVAMLAVICLASNPKDRPAMADPTGAESP
ncbi:unnamed protein product [Closterium sp. Yama58-4]|nr:unnamed protein product [Closterium sp. Yama58-4]